MDRERPIDIALLGLGNVGRTFCDYLVQPTRHLPIRIRAVADSTGGLFVNDAGELMSLVETKRDGATLKQSGRTLLDHSSFISSLKPAGISLLVESLPTNPIDGQPALGLLTDALRRGINVVTVDKGPLVHGFDTLRQAAREGGADFAFNGTTGVTPPDDLAGKTVTEIRGVLNGTTNHILTEMQERGPGFDDALSEARAAGIAEPDPSLDVDGWDTAFKILILAKSLMNAPTRLDEVSRIGIGAATESLIETARGKNRKVRLVGRARIWQGRVRVSVAPKIVASESPFYDVNGTSKAAIFSVANEPDLLIGGTSGRDAISETIAADVIRVSRTHPR